MIKKIKKLYKKITGKGRVLRVFEIPENMVEDVLVLDSHANTPLGKYRFWRKIEEIFPETKEGRWGFDRSYSTHPRIRELNE